MHFPCKCTKIHLYCVSKKTIGRILWKTTDQEDVKSRLPDSQPECIVVEKDLEQVLWAEALNSLPAAAAEDNPAVAEEDPEAE